MINKLIRDGKVAVLYSPGYGAGWSTWNDNEFKEFLLFDVGLVELVLNKELDKIDNYIKEKFGDKYVCTIGAEDLDVEWIPVGTEFRVTEYDGYESIEYMGEIDYFVA